VQANIEMKLTRSTHGQAGRGPRSLSQCWANLRGRQREGATARAFILACGVTDTGQFLIVPADQFLLGYDLAKARLFLNPKTPHQREVWPEEATALQEAIKSRVGGPTTA
jgi:hypothetical protein